MQKWCNLFEVTGLVFLEAQNNLVIVTAVRHCLIPSYFSQLYFLLECRNNLCDGVSVVCSKPLTNKFCTGADLFPAVESVYKHCWRLIHQGSGVSTMLVCGLSIVNAVN